MQWSLKQVDIFTWAATGTGSAIVEAVAGSGKTTTLVELVKRLKGTVAFAAYNKAIAVEIGAKLEGQVDKTKVKSGTFHSFGNSAWRQVAPKVKMDGNKVRDIVAKMDIPERFHAFVIKAVGLSRQWGIGALTPFDHAPSWDNLVVRFELDGTLTKKGEDIDAVDLDELTAQAIQYSIAALKTSAKIADKIIDFDDMIYMPVLGDVKMWQNDWVLVDEAQDTNPIRLALAKKMLRPGGRLIAVGDPRQAIYGFSGADSESLNKIAKEFNAISLPLTTTYRCPKAVVRLAQTWVNHIQADDSAPEGSVTEMVAEDFDKLDATALRQDDAILCRNTAPLVKLAFALIRRRIACHVEGRDIGQGLIKLASQWKVKTVGALRGRLEGYRAKEVEKAMAKGQETKAEQVNDRVETLLVIMDTLKPSDAVSEVVSIIEGLFGDTPEGGKAKSLTLCTIHRSKGREWHRVYWFGRNKYQPSPYARQDWQVEQEHNLMYVACTRAKSELIEVIV
jgi:DNA helicase II / ATP-dependent DNA helicase PcrA